MKTRIAKTICLTLSAVTVLTAIPAGTLSVSAGSVGTQGEAVGSTLSGGQAGWIGGFQTAVTAEEATPTEPPYPFWKDYKNYPDKGTMVYYMGKIYQNKWYANAGDKPDAGDPWMFVEDAEWTVAEDEKNYQKDENAAANSMNKVLTDAEIETLYGGINSEFSPEAAVGRLGDLISKRAS